ncbi:MAG: L-erythro-3,5-diaminohexanoate dehydrogenase, partial [Clostridia bacterium]|nr:L-erythro-3,5-diaminohexanoate dehydrogenase [Clostridia bacterium]
MKTGGNPYGTHRVISPKGILPQPADKIDNDMEIWDNEVLIDVKTLNIDSASFTEICKRVLNKKPAEVTTKEEMEAIGNKMKEIVANAGKHKNPWTGSGGMLLGTVEEIGPKYVGDLKVGDKIATLVSLSLTPLRIDEIVEMRPAIDQVDIKGKAILFQSGIYGKIPADMPEKTALSALDVAGAPAQAAKLCQLNQKVLVIGGGGKSGLLCLYEAKKRVGPDGLVVCAGTKNSIKRAEALDLAHAYVEINAPDAVGMYEMAMEQTKGELFDVVINCVSVPNTEMASILACKDDGTVYFFSMATSFTAAALGAEGVGKDVNMIIGNGYTKNHADVTLQVLREHEGLRKL